MAINLAQRVESSALPLSMTMERGPGGEGETVVANNPLQNMNT